MTDARRRLAEAIEGERRDWFRVEVLPDDIAELLAAPAAEPVPLTLDAAWKEAEAALPEGWLFHGVQLADHSMDDPRGGWGPDWMASASWPGHCEYDDCDHDEAFRVVNDHDPATALAALAVALARPEPSAQEDQG